MNTFWWKGTPNFGDELTRVFAEKYTRHKILWSRPENAELVVTGSIATMLPDGWTGTAVGIGWARAERPAVLAQARVLALRGMLSRDLYGKDVPVLGDPGLLASHLLPPVEQDIELVIVPHWQDRWLRARYPKAEVVDVRGGPITAISKIRRAKRVIASSLHGIIVADAYGIERMWETFPLVQGKGYKFVDHGSVVGYFQPGLWGRANLSDVEAVQKDLIAALAHV